ncbi:fasciclin domain-containing protein, partial [Flavobacteriales bacterium]|nr:fasciclin domain-containing protein [Flavobacteriales bacterium]
MVAQIIVEPLPNPSIMEIVEASENHTYLETAINTANLNETLDTGGPFTLFAPTDEAFTALEVAQPGFIAALLADTETLTSILFYHVVSGITMAEDLNDGDLIPTLNNASLTVSIDGMTYMIDMATVTAANLEASNGVVHVIDMVLVPAEEPGLPTIMEIVEASENHTYLETAINTANLNETLDTGGPFTLFAPTDEAFTALEVAQPGFIAALLADTETLTSILFYHVVSGITMAEDLNDGDLIPTLNTASLTVSIDGMTYMINMATVTTPNLEASNGVVHVIDMVLVPAEEPNDSSTVMDIIENSVVHNTLEAAINEAGLA